MNPIMLLLNLLIETITDSAIDMENTAQDKVSSKAMADQVQAVAWSAAAVSHRRLVSDLTLIRSTWAANQAEDLADTLREHPDPAFTDVSNVRILVPRNLGVDGGDCDDDTH